MRLQQNIKQLHNADSFLEYRKEQEQKHLEKIKNSNNPLDSILTIEINTTELCNRKCVFCPRFDSNVYPNRNLNMSVQTADLIARNLSNYNYKGRLSFSGFSENLLNKNFTKIIKAMRGHLKNNLFECNTNGDKLNPKFVNELYDAGLNILYINLYDGPEQADKFIDIMDKAEISKEKYSLRAHYSQKDYGLKLNNRSGMINWIGLDEDDVNKLKGTPCYYPFYKMFIDWNADVLFCSNDWGREKIIGNLLKNTLQDVWMSNEMKKVRNRLKNGDRTESPCNKCSVKGTLFGKPSFDLINKFYENTNNGII